MKRDIKIIFCVMMLYFLNERFKASVGLPVPGYLLRCHFNDFLGGIAFSAYVNTVLYFSRYRRLNRLWQFLLLQLFCGIAWEAIMPFIFRYSVADIFDICAYVLGGSVYYMISCKDEPS